ncbi:DUF5994 family protein [Pseudonocardia sp. WMMC193]|uniref:DUF5994 family protein n=1 Tax=Pseudonocardia sp. WMMC193 TaxID=2911965 RepID=UPI0035AB9B13
MTSTTTAVRPSVVDAGLDDRPEPPRVRLRGGPATGRIDGAWWPRTCVLASELPSLMGPLAQVLGTLTRVGFHPADWSEADRLRSAAGPVAMSASAGRHTVRVQGSHGGRTLLILPPRTGEMRAADILAAVLVHGHRLGTSELLHPFGQALTRTPAYTAVPAARCETTPLQRQP